MTELIRSVFDDSRKVYGAPRVFRALRHRGVACGRNRVARLMRVAGLRSKTKREYRVKTTDSNHSLPIAPDLIERNFHADLRKQKQDGLGARISMLTRRR